MYDGALLAQFLLARLIRYTFTLCTTASSNPQGAGSHPTHDHAAIHEGAKPTTVHVLLHTGHAIIKWRPSLTVKTSSACGTCLQLQGHSSCDNPSTARTYWRCARSEGTKLNDQGNLRIPVGLCSAWGAGMTSPEGCSARKTALNARVTWHQA